MGNCWEAADAPHCAVCTQALRGSTWRRTDDAGIACLLDQVVSLPEQLAHLQRHAVLPAAFARLKVGPLAIVVRHVQLPQRRRLLWSNLPHRQQPACFQKSNKQVRFMDV